MMSSRDAEGERMIVLISSDHEMFKVKEAVAVESRKIKHIIEDPCANTRIPLSRVNGQILAKVIEYCKRHVDFAAMAPLSDPTAYKIAQEDLKAFDAEFLGVDVDTLVDLTKAAHYLDIKSLVDLTCQTIADMIRGKTPDEIRRVFNTGTNFTPEEEEIRREHAWAFE